MAAPFSSAMLEIITNLVLEQNKQLLDILSQEENIPFHVLRPLLSSHFDVKSQIRAMTNIGLQRDHDRSTK
jgi:hypothetical protein